MKGKVLFVTKGEDENFSEGFDYAADLAQLRSGGMIILFSYSERSFFNKFGDEMGAAAFAEVGAADAAEKYLSEDERYLNEIGKQKVSLLKNSRGGEEVIITNFYAMRGRVLPMITAILEENPSIEIVIMSPTLTKKDSTFQIRKLIKKIPRPVVTMSRPVRA
jgi:hypothetical protein